MINRIIIFLIFFVGGSLGITALSEIESFIMSKGVDDKESKLFVSLFQILFIELILLGVYAIFYREKEKENKGEELEDLNQSLSDQFKQYWASLYSGKKEGNDGLINGVFGATVAISTSVTIAIQITVSVANINPPVSSAVADDLKKFVEMSIVAETRKISDKIDPIETDIGKLKEIVLDLKFRDSGDVKPELNMNEEVINKVTSLIDGINSSLNNFQQFLTSLSESRKNILTEKSYNDGIDKLTRYYADSAERSSEAYKDQTRKILEGLDLQAESINLAKLTNQGIDKLAEQYAYSAKISSEIYIGQTNRILDKLSLQVESNKLVKSTSDGISNILDLQCAEVRATPGFLLALIPEGAKKACDL